MIIQQNHHNKSSNILCNVIVMLLSSTFKVSFTDTFIDKDVIQIIEQNLISNYKHKSITFKDAKYKGFNVLFQSEFNDMEK